MNPRLVLFVAAAVLLVVSLSQVVAQEAANPQEDQPVSHSVALPYHLKDQAGRDWYIRPDGTNGANEYPSDGNGRLTCNSVDFPDSDQAMFNEKLHEITVGPRRVGDFMVTRHVRIDVAHSWCRQVDEFQNATDHDIDLQIDMYHKLAGPQRTFKVLDKTANRSPRRILLEDGQTATGIIGGGRESSLPMTFDFSAAAMGGTEHYARIRLEPRQNVTIVNMHIRRATAKEAIEALSALHDEQVTEDFGTESAKLVANFTFAQRVGVVAPRGTELDLIETSNGEHYSGLVKLRTDVAQTRPTVTDLQLESSFGPLTLPLTTVAGFTTQGNSRMRQLVTMSDGQIFSGRLNIAQVVLEAPGGRILQFAATQIRSVSFRNEATQGNVPAIASTATAAATTNPAVLQLRDGDLLHVRLVPASLLLVTRYGPMRIPADALRGIVFNNEGASQHDLYAVTFVDGSSLGAFLGGGELLVHSLGSAGERDLQLPLNQLARLQLRPADKNLPPGGPTVKLGNGDLLAATLVGQLTLDTSFSALTIDAAEIASLTRSEDSADLTLAFADGTKLSGRIAQASIECQLACGAKLSIPVGVLQQYTVAQPTTAPAKQ